MPTPTLADLPYPLIAGVAVALGLAFGSFLNVVIYRWPRGESLVFPASRCPGCGTPIRGYDNVPVLGWLLLGGKARCCRIPISARYPLIEALGGLTAWAIVQTTVLDLSPATPWWRALLVFAVHLALALGLIAAAFIDLTHMLLPDAITIGGTLLGFASLPLRRSIDWREALFGAAVGFFAVWLPFGVIYGKLRGKTGMGLGDAKLTMLAGAWFGWVGAIFVLFAGAIQGTLTTLLLFALRGRIEEPEAVTREREELRAEIEAAEGEERAQLEAELAADPVGSEPEPGLGAARISFGPFLVLGILELLLFEAPIRAQFEELFRP